MSNADVNSNAAQLQSSLRDWYTNGVNNVNKSVGDQLWIDDKHTVVDKSVLAFPGDHLVLASYKDVIERDGSTSQKIGYNLCLNTQVEKIMEYMELLNYCYRLCVKTDVEVRKCNVLKQAAYSRDIRPEFNCVESRDCLETVGKSLT